MVKITAANNGFLLVCLQLYVQCRECHWEQKVVQIPRKGANQNLFFQLTWPRLEKHMVQVHPNHECDHSIELVKEMDKEEGNPQDALPSAQAQLQNQQQTAADGATAPARPTKEAFWALLDKVEKNMIQSMKVTKDVREPRQIVFSQFGLLKKGSHF